MDSTFGKSSSRSGLNSLNIKVNLLLITLVTIVLVIFGGYNYSDDKSTLKELLHTNADDLLSRMSVSLGDPLWNFNDPLLDGIIASEMNYESVQAIWVESNGKLRLAQGRDSDWNVISITEKPTGSSFVLETDVLFIDGSDSEIAGKVTVFIDDHHVLEALQAELLKIVVQTLILDVILFLLISQIMNRLIVVPLVEVTAAVEDISEGEGDLTRQLNEDKKDEFGLLAHGFNKFTGKLRELVKNIMGVSESLANSAVDAARISLDSSEGLKVQQQEMTQVATATTEMAATVKEVAQNSNEAAEAAKQADQQTIDGNAVALETIESIKELSIELKTSGEVIQTLAKDSEDIGSILDVINGISEQTNLLALNAAIEAARAGEMGRGFAVVADEVRNLAQRTSEATTEIKDMIQKLQQGANSAMEVMDSSHKRTEDCVVKAGQTGEALTEIKKAVGVINDMNLQIASAAEEQSVVGEDINRRVEHIAGIVDQSAVHAEEAAKASESQSELAVRLKQLINTFKA